MNRKFAAVLLSLVLLAMQALPVGGQARSPSCDRECLRGVITDYLNAMLAHTPQSLPLAPGARFTEDTKTMALGEGLWKGASKLRTYRQDFLDVSEGQAASHVIVVRVTDDGLPNLSATAAFRLTVNNVAPAVTAAGDAALVEGGALSGSGSFAYPGPDTWTATVDYGDGTGEQPLPLAPDRTFALGHTYRDDGEAITGDY